MVKWIKEWKLNLNGSKSEESFFSNKKEDLGWTPTLSIGCQDVRFELTPRLLGVTLDRNMSFGDHVKLTVSKVAKKMSLLRAVANSTWAGGRKTCKRYSFHTSQVSSISQVVVGSPGSILTTRGDLRLPRTVVCE